MPVSASTTDRIEKQVLLNAPRARVWRALVDTQEFGSWFGAALGPGAFTPGAKISGPITHAGYEHLTFAVNVEVAEPEQRLVWRWYPDPEAPSAEPTTQVEFTLSDVAGGTLLRVVESGLDTIPADRRERVYRGNSEGWSAQMDAIAGHVGKNAD
jgi:uncharacterized protein YndB with AHSA1/START domain